MLPPIQAEVALSGGATTLKFVEGKLSQRLVRTRSGSPRSREVAPWGLEWVCESVVAVPLPSRMMLLYNSFRSVSG